MSSVGGMTMCWPPSVEFVVEAVLAADERHAVGQGHVAARLGRAHQRAEHLGPVGVAPAEVVEQGDARRIGADGDDVAHRLVDGRGGHAVRVEVAVVRVDAAADGQARASRARAPA